MALAVRYTNVDGRTVKENRGGVKRGYVPDTLGSTIALVDSTGAITDEWKYWPYGEVASRTGTNPTPFTFVGTLGYFKDLASTLTYVRARFYQALTGQWMMKDPLWPGQRPYAYADCAPVRFSDPSGESSSPLYRACVAFLCASIDTILKILDVLGVKAVAQLGLKELEEELIEWMLDTARDEALGCQFRLELKECYEDALKKPPTGLLGGIVAILCSELQNAKYVGTCGKVYCPNFPEEWYDESVKKGCINCCKQTFKEVGYRDSCIDICKRRC